MKKLKIALTVGHRESSQGASHNGISEYDFADKIIDEVIEKSKHIQGVELKKFYRRDKKGYRENMIEQHSRIDAWGADLDIEFHFNASANKKATGHEVLYASKRGKKYATLLVNQYTKNLQTKNRGVKNRRNGRGSFGLMIGKSASLIVEPFFSHNVERYSAVGHHRDMLIKSYVEFLEEICE